MPIRFPVPPGTILLCDYSGGFRPPEMVKRRPVVVVSPRLRHRDNLCAVVPLSTTAPTRELAYVCRIELAESLPAPFNATVCWAKADMLATVGFGRLDMFRTPRDHFGKRDYLRPVLSPDDFRRVKVAVLCGLGLAHLTPHLK